MRATSRPVLATALIALGVSQIAHGQAPEIRYDFKAGRHYGYDLTIEIDTEDYTETRSGYSLFRVDEADDEKIQMMHRGDLDPDRKMKPGAGMNTGAVHNPVYPSHITIDRYGELDRATALDSLDFVLGHMETLCIEHLPDKPQNQWVWENEFQVVETSGFSSSSFGGLHGKKREAKERSDYSIKDASGDSVRIEKKYRMQSGEGVPGMAHFDMTGGGKFLFDRREGVVSTLDMNYRLVMRERDKSSTVTAKVICRLMSPAKLDRLVDKLDDSWKQMTGGASEELPKSALKPGERPKLLRDLASSDRKLQEAAVERLISASPDDRPGDIAAALAVIVREGEGLGLQVKAAKAIKVWAAPGAVAALTEAASNSAFIPGAPADSGFPLMDAAIEALGAVGTETAARAICQKIEEPTKKPVPVLIGMGPVAEIPAIEMLGAGVWGSRAACEVLAEIGGLRSVLPLETESKSGYSRSQAAAALETIAKREGMAIDELVVKATQAKPEPTSVAAADYRTWTDISGNFEIEAQMLSVEKDVVKLKARAGKIVEVPFDRLSQADREYIAGSRSSRPSSPPNSQPPGAPTGEPRDTKLVGGSGGFPFRMLGRDNQHLVGIQYGIGSWAGRQAVSIRMAVFDPKQRPRSGLLVAKPGYAIGALTVDAEDLVHALLITFMRIKPDGSLDPSDSYMSPAIGNPAGHTPVVLGGTGAPVVGIHGRRGIVLDAVGLVICGE